MLDAIPTLPEADIEKHGTTYRILCRQQGNSVLMNDSRAVTFAEFVILQNARKEVALTNSRFRRSRAT
jgi:hypothetical protein